MTDSSTPNQPLDPAAEETTAEVEGYGLLDLGGVLGPPPPPIVPDAPASHGPVSEIVVTKKTDCSSGKLFREAL